MYLHNVGGLEKQQFYFILILFNWELKEIQKSNVTNFSLKSEPLFMMINEMNQLTNGSNRYMKVQWYLYFQRAIGQTWM